LNSATVAVRKAVEGSKLKVERGTAESGALGIALGDSAPHPADAREGDERATRGEWLVARKTFDRLDHREGPAKLIGGDDMI
jgi:hypothetical protein